MPESLSIKGTYRHHNNEPVKRTSLVAILLLMSVGPYLQPSAAAENAYWVDASGGFCFYPAHFISAGANIHYAKDGRLYKARLVSSEEFNLFGPSPTERVNNIGILVGNVFRWRISWNY